MELLSENFGAMVTIFNPMYPLKFERYGNGNIDDDPEFRSHVESLASQAHEVATEFGAEEEFYSNVAVFRAEKKARMAYAQNDPVAEANKALEISPYSPEAYNVKAQFEATTYEEALEFYNKAVEVAPNLSEDFQRALSKGRCWSQNHLRSYFRAVHGQANTLRKLGRCEEALKIYLTLEKLDPEFYSWSSFANWRYHVLEVYMKLGDDKGALRFAMKKSNSEAFQLASSSGAWFWSKALLDYRYKQHRGYAEDYYDKVISDDDPHSMNVFNSFEGTILRAFQASPETLSFLTGERKLPNCSIPFHMGNWKSLSNVATYCMTNAELWCNTPGALEWASYNARTFMCSLIVGQDKRSCKVLGLKGTISEFEDLLCKGVFLDAKVERRSKTLVHEAACHEMPQHLKCLISAGAQVRTVSKQIPQPLHMACYYGFKPKIIKILCKAGADPTDACGLHYSPLQMAAEQGMLEALKAAFECLPAHSKKDRKVLDGILLAVFQSSCYECVTGLGQLCQRCVAGDCPHPSNATWTGVLDFLIDLKYKPSKDYLESMLDFSGKRKLYAYLVAKLKGEEPPEPAEGPGLVRRPLALRQQTNMLDLLSALGRNTQKQLPCPKVVIPKSATCKNCKGREKKMMVCGQCKQAFYCSKECQKKDWKQHKKSCASRKE